MFHLRMNQVIGFYKQNVSKHLWKSKILSKDAGHRPASLVKMPLFHKCFSNIFLVKPTSWFLQKWNTGRKWIKSLFSRHCCSPAQIFRLLFSLWDWGDLIRRNDRMLERISGWLLENKFGNTRKLTQMKNYLTPYIKNSHRLNSSKVSSVLERKKCFAKPLSI